MIRVTNLKKFYGDFEALKGITFEIKPSRITALLGPNGAGKTTTLRILSGYLVSDDGEIEFYGKKLSEENITSIKKMIGYIPENNPLYDDFEVIDYLNWIADVYEVDRKNVYDAIEKCSLKEVISKKISTLSKGYKQRVSLAKAILHNPEILLLDEPTTGLDPNQARQTRQLIKDLSAEKTIVISTHILSEVEMLADDIIIINKGTIASCGTKEGIINSYSKNSYIIKTRNTENDIKIENAKSIEKYEGKNETIWKIEFEGSSDMREYISQYLTKNNINFLEFYRETVTLDEIFRRITES